MKDDLWEPTMYLRWVIKKGRWFSYWDGLFLEQKWVLKIPYSEEWRMVPWPE